MDGHFSHQRKAGEAGRAVSRVLFSDDKDGSLRVHVKLEGATTARICRALEGRNRVETGESGKWVAIFHTNVKPEKPTVSQPRLSCVSWLRSSRLAHYFHVRSIR